MGKRTVILVMLAVMLISVVLALPALAASKSVRLTADNKFVPGNQTVAPGDTVNFVWEGGFHDVIFSDGQKSGAPTADTGTNYSRTFSDAGTFSYICSVHESVGMKGTITVQAAGSGGTTATTDPSSMPFTGPEDSVVPALGLVLVLGGGVALIRTVRSHR